MCLLTVDKGLIEVPVVAITSFGDLNLQVSTQANSALKIQQWGITLNKKFYGIKIKTKIIKSQFLSA